MTHGFLGRRSFVQTTPVATRLWIVSQEQDPYPPFPAPVQLFPVWNWLLSFGLIKVFVKVHVVPRNLFYALETIKRCFWNLTHCNKKTSLIHFVFFWPLLECDPYVVRFYTNPETRLSCVMKRKWGQLNEKCWLKKCLSHPVVHPKTRWVTLVLYHVSSVTVWGGPGQNSKSFQFNSVEELELKWLH